LKGVEVLVNTYWIRFDYKENTQTRAVENTRKLINAASRAGVKRIVHISITNPSADSPCPTSGAKPPTKRRSLNQACLINPAANSFGWCRRYSDQ